MIISQAYKAPAGAHREPRAKHLAEWKQTVSHGGSWPYIKGARRGSGKSLCPSCLNTVAYIQQVLDFCGLCQDFGSKKTFIFFFQNVKVRLKFKIPNYSPENIEKCSQK